MILKLTFHSKENSKKCHSFNSELSKSAVNTIPFPVTQKTASEKHFKPNWSETVITQRFIHEKKKQNPSISLLYCQFKDERIQKAKEMLSYMNDI